MQAIDCRLESVADVLNRGCWCSARGGTVWKWVESVEGNSPVHFEDFNV